VIDPERVRREAERARQAIQAAEETRRRVEAVRLQVRLRRERYGARSGQRAGELGEDRQISVQPDPLDAPHAER
jgi:hypothetical protein